MTTTDEIPGASEGTAGVNTTWVMPEYKLGPDKDALRSVVDSYHAPDPGDIQSFKKRGIELRYTSHATVTKILNHIDVTWTLEPLMVNGVPYIDERNGVFTMYGHLTVLGKRVFCVGSCDNTKADWAKELYGDMIRNGAMRLGIHIDLWSKDFPEAEASKRPAARKAPEKISAKPIEGGGGKEGDAAGGQVPSDDKTLADAVRTVKDEMPATAVEYVCGTQPERFKMWPAIEGCGRSMTEVDGNLVMRTKTYLCPECAEKWVSKVGRVIGDEK